jgi:hypothetical protein
MTESMRTQAKTKDKETEKATAGMPNCGDGKGFHQRSERSSGWSRAIFVCALAFCCAGSFGIASRVSATFESFIIRATAWIPRLFDMTF